MPFWKFMYSHKISTLNTCMFTQWHATSMSNMTLFCYRWHFTKPEIQILANGG